MYKQISTFILLAALSSAASAAKVDGTDSLDAKRFQLRARAIQVMPDESSNTSIGGHVEAGNALMPEVDVSYYFTDNISAELIAATSDHSLSHSTAGDLGRAWILPPTLTLQYHPLPHGSFDPYVGAGVNYSLFYNERSAKYNGINSLDVQGGWGTALQVGADYWVDEHWGVNADVKKIFLDVDAKLNGGAIRADIDLDPWVIGAGVSYRF